MLNHSDSNTAFYLLGLSPELKSHEDLRGYGDEDQTAWKAEPHELSLLKAIGVERRNIGPITAWFKLIDRSEFEGPEAERNLADINWLTPLILAHESIVSNLSERMPFYPSRFGAIFSSIESLKTFAVANVETLENYFSFVVGRREWGIKLIGNSAIAAELVARRDGIIQMGKPQGGANYLKLRQMQRVQTASIDRWFNEVFTRFRSALETQFTAVVSRPIRQMNNDRADESLVGNLALLVNDQQAAQLVESLERWRDHQVALTGVRMELTGPWPAYSFCPALVLPELAKAA